MATRSVYLPRSPRSVREARALLRADLAAGLPQQILDDVLLVASELVSNSMRHARPVGDDAVGLAWERLRHAVVVRVTDGGGRTLPRARPPATSATGGRGLAMVAAVSARWGVERDDGTVTVWAVVGRVGP